MYKNSVLGIKMISNTIGYCRVTDGVPYINYI